MKYTSILAGALGLMALAACTNNDEVKMEQPEVAKAVTINVTYGRGADTRLTFEKESTDDGVMLKGAWQKGDKIGLYADPDEDVLVFKTNGTGATASFSSVGDVVIKDNEGFLVYYPNVPQKEGFDFSNQTGLLEDLGKHAYAVGFALFKKGKVENPIVLKPMCAVLYIPEGTVIENLGKVECDYTQATLTISGDDVICKYDPTKEESIIYGNININSGDVALFTERDGDNVVRTAVDIYIALPINAESMNCALKIDIADPSTVSTHATIDIVVPTGGFPVLKTGYVYTLSTSNLVLRPSVV